MKKSGTTPRAAFLVAVVFTFVFMAVPGLSVRADLYLSPGGGFARVNSDRTLVMNDGTSVPATMNTALLRMIRSTPENGEIKIAMYNFDHEEILEELISLSKNKGILVKILLDKCAGWTDENVENFVHRIRKAINEARNEEKELDIHLKIVTQRVMEFHGRTKVLADGKKIYGTMHQKFGVICPVKGGPPLHCFNGSANISPSAEKTFAENRIFFMDAPMLSLAFANQFARLWNLYSVPRAGLCPAETVVPLPASPEHEVIFNGEHVGFLLDYQYQSIESRILSVMGEVSRHGSMDIAMFSFTHRGIADRIISIAKKRPDARFRLLFDHSMMTPGPDRIGIMPPEIEERIKREGIDNIEVRYRFRANAYGWDKEKKAVGLDHFKSYLLHHKMVIIDRKKMVYGSYNWSGSAEERNFEDAMIIDSSGTSGKEVVSRFLAEFDTLWNSPYESAARLALLGAKPLVISGEYGRLLESRIIKVLSDKTNYRVRGIIDWQKEPTFKDIAARAKIDMTEVIIVIGRLKMCRLVETFMREDGKMRARLAD